MTDPPLPADDDMVIGTTRYRRGQRVRLRPGLEGPDAGLEDCVGVIVEIHRNENGAVFLSVDVTTRPDAPGGPVRQVYVAPAQVDDAVD